MFPLGFVGNSRDSGSWSEVASWLQDFGASKVLFLDLRGSEIRVMLLFFPFLAPIAAALGIMFWVPYWTKRKRVEDMY